MTEALPTVPRQSSMPEKTLRIGGPIGTTIARASLILVVVLGLGETLTRQSFIAAHLPVPSLGSAHYEFEYDVAAAETLKQDTGQIDCLFVGSSMPNTGINPEVFAQAYQAQTGHAIVCFNFGLAGAGAAAIGALSQLWIADLHPKLIIYGTSARDFANNTVDQFPGQPDPILNTPWVQYRLGGWSLAGWLVEHSVAYRYFLRFQTLFGPDQSFLYTGVGRYG